MKRRTIASAFLTLATLSPIAYFVWSQTIDSVLPFSWSQRRGPEAFIADPLFRPEAADRTEAAYDGALDELFTAHRQAYDTKSTLARTRVLAAGDRLDDIVQPPSVARSVMIERNTILVMFRPGTSASKIRAVLERHRLVARSGVPRIRFFVCQTEDPGTNATDPQEATRLRAIAASLEKNERQWVEMAEVNAVLGKTSIPRPNTPAPRDWFAAAPEDPFVLSRFPQAWNFNDAIRRRGGRVAVGVLDVGFLNASRTARRDLDITRVGPGSGVDDHGHLVAGIIGAQFDNQLIADGGSPFAEVHGCAPSPPGRVFGETPEDREFNRIGMTVGDLIDCLDKLAAVPVRVINASVGYNWRDNHRIRPAQNPPTDRTRRAQTMVIRHGTMVRRMLEALRGNIVVVSAAGNDSGDPAMWGSPFNWAALDSSSGTPATNVIVVEASNATASARLPESSEGGTIRAVGVNIPSISANRLREEINALCRLGTSCAAPLVTATVAQMLAVNPALSVADIKRNLDVSVPPNPPTSLNAFAAVQASARRPDTDLADYDRDNDVDLADFRRFREDFQAFDEGRRTGIFRIDLNGDGVRNANDARFCRSDFDGQNGIHRDDLNVMIRAWTDRSVDPNTLPTRLLQ
ncbi:MAG TPA: S8 family serine peptidase [Thermoanaerobaculia bacterium]